MSSLKRSPVQPTRKLVCEERMTFENLLKVFQYLSRCARDPPDTLSALHTRWPSITRNHALVSHLKQLPSMGLRGVLQLGPRAILY